MSGPSRRGPGRPKLPAGVRKLHVSLWIPSGLVKAIDRVRKSQGASRSDWVTGALEDVIEAEKRSGKR